MTAREHGAPDCAGRNGAPAHGKHTPGPWKVGEVYVSDCQRFAYLPIKTMHGINIADVEISTHYTVEDPLAQANARLIAAAPEMYESLLSVRGFADAPDEIAEDEAGRISARIDAAIAKAEGRS